MLAGSALADTTDGPPINNLTDGAQTGQTRANYPGLGDVGILNMHRLAPTVSPGCFLVSAYGCQYL